MHLASSYAVVAHAETIEPVGATQFFSNADASKLQGEKQEVVGLRGLRG